MQLVAGRNSESSEQCIVRFIKYVMQLIMLGDIKDVSQWEIQQKSSENMIYVFFRVSLHSLHLFDSTKWDVCVVPSHN